MITKDEFIKLIKPHEPCQAGLDLIDRCEDMEEVFTKMSGVGWEWLLEVQPQFSDKCNWSKLDGRDWSNLLRDQPQFAEHCDWFKLTDWDWARLLRYQPQLEKYKITKLSRLIQRICSGFGALFRWGQ
jgi:hypothetical protein